MKYILSITMVLLLLVSGSSFISMDEWEVPTKYKNMENPTDMDDKEGLAIAKGLWSKHCKSCHGKEGLGDGSKSGELDTDPGDFSTEEFHEQTDGSLYYKTTYGRDEMPAYDKKIPSEEDRWLLVNYMRTFAE